MKTTSNIIQEGINRNSFSLHAQRIFANRHELDNYLNVMQSRGFGDGEEAIPRMRLSGSIREAAGALTAGA